MRAQHQTYSGDQGPQSRPMTLSNENLQVEMYSSMSIQGYLLGYNAASIMGFLISSPFKLFAFYFSSFFSLEFCFILGIGVQEHMVEAKGREMNGVMILDVKITKNK